MAWGSGDHVSSEESRDLVSFALRSALAFHDAVRPVHLSDPHPTDLPLSFFLLFYFFIFLVNYSVQDTHTHTHTHGWQLTSTTWLWKSPFLVGPTPTGASLPHSFVHARVKKSFLKKKKVKKKHKKWTISYTRHNSVIRGVIFIKRIVILQPTSLW